MIALQGYFLLRLVKVLLYELCDGWMEGISIQTGQHDQDSIVPYIRTRLIDRTPFNVTYKKEATTQNVIRTATIIWHIHIR